MATTAPASTPAFRPYDTLFGVGPRAFAAFAVVGSFVMPPHGVGFTICLLDRYAHLPCPGCGLTRSFACLSHGLVASAVAYHPFGPLLYLWAWSAVVVTLMGASRRARLAAWFTARTHWAQRIYIGAVVAFLIFGFARLGVRMWWSLATQSG